MQLALFNSYDYYEYIHFLDEELERNVLNSAEELWWKWHPNYPYTTYQETFGLGALGSIRSEEEGHVMMVGIMKKSEPMSLENLQAAAIALLVYAYGETVKEQNGK